MRPGMNMKIVKRNVRPEACFTSDKIYYGTQYYRHPTPPEKEWPKDMSEMKAFHFDLIKVHFIWRHHEPLRGRFRWEAIDALLALCEKHGIRVVPQLMVEMAPAWIFNKHQCFLEDNQGRKLRPIADGGWHLGGYLPCLDNAAVMRAAENFISKAVRRYKDSPAILAWNIYEEAGVRSLRCHLDENPDSLVCACRDSRLRYLRWLRRQYGTIEKFNAFLGKSYGKWGEVEVPLSWNDYGSMLLWRKWAAENLAKQIACLRNAVREEDARHPVTAHASPGVFLRNSLLDTGDDALNAAKVDFYGSSFPPASLWQTALRSDWMRAISKYYWMAEVYPALGLWKSLDADDIKQSVWTGIAHGARGVVYWQFKPERLGQESNGHGLVALDGGSTPQAEEAKKIGRILHKFGNELAKFSPPAGVLAMVYSQDACVLSHLERKFMAKRDKNFGGYPEAFGGSYRLFWSSGMPVDILPAESMKDMFRYPMVYLPMPVMLSADAARRIKDYVADGGILVSEASPGLREANTWVSPAVPGNGLDSLFGCLEKNRHVIGADEMIKFCRGGKQIIARHMIAELEPTTAKAVAVWKNGKTAITINPCGKGQAILIGCYPGFCEKNTIWTEYLSRLINFSPCVKFNRKPDEVSYRALKNKERDLVFVFNESDKVENISILCPKYENVKFIIPEDMKNIGQNNKQIRLRLAGKSVVAFIGKR